MSRYDQPQLLSAFQRALQPIHGVRTKNRQTLTQAQSVRAQELRRAARTSGVAFLNEWWGEAILTRAETEQLMALSTTGQDVVCRMLLSRLAAHAAATPAQLARLRAVAEACSAESRGAGLLRASCTPGGITTAVLPTANEVMLARRALSGDGFPIGFSPQLQRFVIAALADALHSRGFRADDVVWMTEQVEWVQSALLTNTPIRPQVLGGLRLFRARLMGRPPSGTSASGIELLRLRRALNDILDLLPQDGPEPARGLVEQFEQALSKSVGEALERATKSLFQAAGSILSMGSRVSFFGGSKSDADRAKERVVWLKEHIAEAEDFVIWHPSGWLGRRQLANCPAGIVRAMMPNETFGGSALPLLIRADFARGCVVMSLEKQFGIAVEFCPWGANGRLPIHQHPSSVLQRRTTSRPFPLGWEAAATGALRSLLL